MINNYWRKYEGGNRLYSTNFFTPEVMTNVLQLLTENKSINEIAKIINFSAKAIHNYLKNVFNFGWVNHNLIEKWK